MKNEIVTSSAGKVKPKHNISIESRNKMAITGVSKVVDAHAKCISLLTSEGSLIIRGDELKICAFSEADGSLTLDGRIDRLEYGAVKRSLVGRLFG